MWVLWDLFCFEMISWVKDGKINFGLLWKRKVCLVCCVVFDFVFVFVRSWIFF